MHMEPETDNKTARGQTSAGVQMDDADAVSTVPTRVQRKPVTDRELLTGPPRGL